MARGYGGKDFETGEVMAEPKLVRSTTGYTMSNPGDRRIVPEIELFVSIEPCSDHPDKSAVNVRASIDTRFAEYLKELPFESQQQLQSVFRGTLERALRSAFTHGAFPPEETPGKVQ